MVLLAFLQEKALSIGFTMDVPQDGLCHSCGKRGHLSRNCPNSENMRKPYITCFRCGKLGHVKSKCPELDSEGALCAVFCASHYCCWLTEQVDSHDSAAIQSAIIKKKKRNKSVVRDIEIKSPRTHNDSISESSPPNSHQIPPSHSHGRDTKCNYKSS